MKKWLPMSRRDFFKLSLAGISSLAMASCTGRFLLKTLNSAVNYDKYSSNQNISQINLAYLNAADFRGRTMNIFETITPEMALFRIKQLAKFFIEEKIDIFCGGEFDSYDTYKTGCLNQSLELAKFMGSPYNYVLMDEYMKSPLWTTGNCIISKFPLKRRKRHIFGGRMLDKRLKHMYKDFIHITSKVGRRELEIIVNHLYNRKQSVRLSEVKDEIKYLRRLKEKNPKSFFVLPGDYNADSNSRTLKLFEDEGFYLPSPTKNPKTFPSYNPKWDLDHILSSSNVEIKDYRAFDFPWSDHKGLICRLEFKHE